MSEHFVDLAEAVDRRPIKHLGTFRTVPGENGVTRDITIPECRLDGAVLRTLRRRENTHTREGMPEGTLASWVQRKITDSDWRACCSRLLDWKLIRIVPAYFGDARRIALTDSGDYWANELIGERQRAGKPIDAVEE